MSSMRRIIAAAVFLAGTAAPAFSCPARVQPSACAMSSAQSMPCHKAAAPAKPAKKADCGDMLCCRPEFRDRVAVEAADIRPAFHAVAALPAEAAVRAVRSVRAASGSDPPVSARSAFLPAGPSRAPPSFLA